MAEPKPINLAEFMKAKNASYDFERPKRFYSNAGSNYVNSSGGYNFAGNSPRYSVN